MSDEARRSSRRGLLGGALVGFGCIPAAVEALDAAAMAPNVRIPPLPEPPSTVVGANPQAAFSFEFPFWASADIRVYVDDELLDAAAYTVTGLALQSGQAVEGGYGSGTVTLDTAVSNVTVTIDRSVENSRETQFSRSAPLGMPALNGDLNRLTARQQDLERHKVTRPFGDRAGLFLAFDASGNEVASSGTGADAGLRTDLAAEGGAALIKFATPAGWTVNDELLLRGTPLTRYGASSSASATVNTRALHDAQEELLERWPGAEDFYPAGVGEPTVEGLKDFTRRDRRTGTIIIPDGSFRVAPGALGSLEHPRAPYVGFRYQGADRRSSVLLLESGGEEAWFYDIQEGGERYQALSFHDIAFRGDDPLKASFAKFYSSGGPKQFLVNECSFENIYQYMQTEGSGNADLNRTVNSYIEAHGDLLTLDNPQSVQHDFIANNYRLWANWVRVKQHGGGNVNFAHGSADHIWDERISPAGGNFMFTHDSDANIGQGNGLFSYRNLRVEIEAVTSSASNPPFGIVNTTDDPNTAMPRVDFDTVGFVNGRTAIINGSGVVTGEEYRPITAVRMFPRKEVTFRNCTLLKTFEYTAGGDIDAGSPQHGGICLFENCFDGVNDELPAASSTKTALLSRVSRTGNAGRFIVRGMKDHTTGSSFTKRLLDGDPYWTSAFGGDVSVQELTESFKHPSNGWPFAASDGNDHYINIPYDLVDATIRVLKPANGAASANAYQLKFGTADKATVLGSSTAGQFKDEHLIELPHVNLSKGSYRLWAEGDGTDFDNGGYAIIRRK